MNHRMLLVCAFGCLSADAYQNLALAQDENPCPEVELFDDFTVEQCGTGVERQGCYPLTLDHSGSGEAPEACPPCTNTNLCCPGYYLPDELVELRARPAPGFRVQSWTRTDDDASTEIVNTVTMPPEAHSALVSYVTALRFNSGFEKELCREWSDRLPGDACFACPRPAEGVWTTISGRLAPGQTAAPCGAGFATDSEGEHVAILLGPDNADFDLSLMMFSGRQWLPVATGASTAASEVVRRFGQAGIYRWEVTATSGHGDFALLTDFLPLDELDTNRLERTSEVKKQGQYALAALFFEGSRVGDYLLSEHPGGTDSYEASFFLNVAENLYLKGKQEIFRLSDGPKAFLKLFLRRRNPTGRNASIELWTRDAGRFKALQELKIRTGKWKKINLQWQAPSSPGEEDGFVAIFEGSRVPDRVPFSTLRRVDQVYIGMVQRSRRSTAGEIYFDTFRSSWED